MTSMRMNERQRSYKKGIDGDSIRRRRDETTTQIRKSIKEDRLNQRRRMIRNDSEGNNDVENFDFNNEMDLSSAVSPDGISTLPRITAMIQSRNVKEQTYAVSQLRRLLSMERNPPIQEVVNMGAVPLLVNFLQRHDIPELQFEAAWALTNIASGTTQHTEVVINNGAVPLFCELLLSTNDDVCEQAVWALGNISGDSPACRDYVLSSGTMVPLLSLLRRSAGKLSILRNATWTLSNLCRGKPQPEFTLVQPALEFLPHLIYSPDEEVITDACWALSYLSDGTNEKVQMVLDAGILRRVVDLLGHSAVTIQTPTLRIVGNIVSGNEHQTQAALDCGALAQLLPLMKHPKKLIRKETCWTISNITAGTCAQIQEVIDANLVPSLIHQLVTGEFDVQKEAAWAVSNATSSGTHDQIKYLVQQGCIPPIINLLECPDPAIIIVCLDALIKILKVGEYDCGINEENKMKLYIEEAEGITRIQDLQYHEHEDVYQKALLIIQDYFDGDEEDDFALEPGFDPASGQFEFNGAYETTQPFNFS